MQEWAREYGAAVRQRTVRPETTMAKHGTLPEFIYQRTCLQSGDKVEVVFDELNTNTIVGDVIGDTVNVGVDDDMEVAVYENDTDRIGGAINDEIEYEQTSGEEEDEGDENLFMLGIRTRYGRNVRFTNNIY